jgi:hypothetical protein
MRAQSLPSDRAGARAAVRTFRAERLTVLVPAACRPACGGDEITPADPSGEGRSVVQAAQAAMAAARTAPSANRGTMPLRQEPMVAASWPYRA